MTILEADDASQPETALKAATKVVRDDRVDVLMGTFNAECALVVSGFAKQEKQVIHGDGSASAGTHHAPRVIPIPSSLCPNAAMLAQAVVPHWIKTFGTRWFMVTTSSLDGKAMAQAVVTASRMARNLWARWSCRSGPRTLPRHWRRPKEAAYVGGVQSLWWDLSTR